jgi:hypothetical protein
MLLSHRLMAGRDISVLTLGSPVTYATPGTYYYTPPAGVQAFEIELWGGGGGSGGSYGGNGTGSSRGGGGAGGYLKARISRPTSGNFVLIVGAAGYNGTNPTFGCETCNGTGGGLSQVYDQVSVGGQVNAVAYGGAGSPKYPSQTAGAGGTTFLNSSKTFLSLIASSGGSGGAGGPVGTYVGGAGGSQAYGGAGGAGATTGAFAGGGATPGGGMGGTIDYVGRTYVPGTITAGLGRVIITPLY